MHRNRIWIGLLAAVTYLSTAVTGHALEVLMTASFTPIGSDPTVEWSLTPDKHGGELKTIGAPGAANVMIDFWLASTGLDYGPLPAVLTLDAISHSSGTTGYGPFPSLFGPFSFAYAGSTPYAIGARIYQPGDILLRSYVTGGEGGCTLRAISHCFTRAPQAPVADGSGMPFTLVFDTLADPTQSSFTAPLSGAFALYSPEPATWALMLAGFGMVGWRLRRSHAAHLGLAAEPPRPLAE